MGRGERHRQAGLGVVERLDDVAIDPLVAVDLPPRRAPVAEVGGQAVGSLGERRQLLVGARGRGHVVIDRDAGALGLGAGVGP